MEIRQWGIFVDGSRAHHGSGWGLTIIAYRSAPPHVYFGSTRGRIDGSNNRSELHAACWAFYLACLPPEHAPAIIHFDNLLVEGPILGTYNFRLHLDLAQASRTLAWYARELRHLGTMHVKAHSGHPWNELADKLAGEPRLGHPECHSPHPPILTSDLREGCLRQHAAATLSLEGCGLPTLVDDTLHLTPTDPPVFPPASVYPALGVPLDVVQSEELRLSVAQANVLSLDTDRRASGLRERRKAHYLARQWEHRSVHVAFLQETRTEGPATRAIGRFHAFASGCSVCRQEGVEI